MTASFFDKSDKGTLSDFYWFYPNCLEKDPLWKQPTINVLVKSKVECIFPIVISSEFRIGQYRDDDHREDAPLFTT